MFAFKVTSLSSYGIPPSSYSCPCGGAKARSPSRLPVSVPMEFLPVPIAAQVGVQRYVRPQSYQSQFLWLPPSSYGCPGGGAKVCSPSKLPVLVLMEFLPVPMAALVGVQRYVRPQSYLPRWGCKGMFALKVTSLSSYGFLPVPMAALVGVQRYVRPQSYQPQFLWIPPSSYGCPA